MQLRCGGCCTAAQAGTSARTLTRRFRQQLDTTPLARVLRARVCRAQALLESTEQTTFSLDERQRFALPRSLAQEGTDEREWTDEPCALHQPVHSPPPLSP
jgi:AraC-like DNA-binding protein